MPSRAADRRLAVRLSLGRTAQACTDRARGGVGADDGVSEVYRYAAAEAFLRVHDQDWAVLFGLIGPCRHNPKAAGEPYEALVPAIAYRQLTAKAGDAMIDRLRNLTGSMFPAPAQIVAFDPGRLRARGFSAAKVATIQAIAQVALDGVVPTCTAADQMDDEALITRLVSIKGVG